MVPISLFITDKGNENVAISLTLLPRKIPSREVHLTLNSQDLQTVYTSSEAEKWEKSQPYVSGIKKALREIALQRVPSGYQLTPSLRTMSFLHALRRAFAWISVRVS